MKAHVYAVSIQGVWRWNMTVDIRADLSFWGDQTPAQKARLLLLEPELSLGQAIWLKEELTLRPPALPQPDKLKEEIEQRWSLGPHARASLGKSFKLTLIERGGNDEIISNDTENTIEQITALLQGRSLLAEEWNQFYAFHGIAPQSPDQLKVLLQTAYLRGRIKLTNGIARIARRTLWKQSIQYQCQRCGSGESSMHWSTCHHCGDSCPYCEECLTMGRVRFCSLLLQGTGSSSTADTSTKSDETVPLADGWRSHLTGKWGLSPAQTEASLAGLNFLVQSSQGKRAAPASLTTKKQQRDQRSNQFLIWAVTGAGKTEMIFPLLEYGLNQGGRVAVATPRKDVVLELGPRIQKAFPGCSLVTLYGGSPQRWERGDITLATTHQLLRFRESFHLVVIDELDAFPYHNNPMLQFAARQVIVPGGQTLFLSATPPQAMQKEARRGRLPHVKVPVRYHRHPLPIPRLLRIRPVEYYISKQKLPPLLIKQLSESLERGAQIFVFISKIKWVDPIVTLLRKVFGDTVIEGTSSTDPLRSDKVIGFRQREITLLVTTTILERGVTVPKTDVFILNADASLFDEASLVQMAGRAGRSKDDPAGRVFFVASDVTRSQTGAIRQMKQMNRLARSKGFLVAGKEGGE